MNAPCYGLPNSSNMSCPTVEAADWPVREHSAGVSAEAPRPEATSDSLRKLIRKVEEMSAPRCELYIWHGRAIGKCSWPELAKFACMNAHADTWPPTR